MSTYTADQDPAEFTVAEVTKFLDTADAETTVAVKAQEDAGKKRVGILTHEPAPADSDEDGYTRRPVDAYQPGEPIEPEGDTQE